MGELYGADHGAKCVWRTDHQKWYERGKSMGYQDEWLLLEAEDDIDEVEHRQPTEEFLYYYGDDYPYVQAKRDGAGTGFSDERLLYSKSG